MIFIWRIALSSLLVLTIAAPLAETDSRTEAPTAAAPTQSKSNRDGGDRSVPRLSETFDRIDEDGDGMIDRDEFVGADKPSRPAAVVNPCRGANPPSWCEI